MVIYKCDKCGKCMTTWYDLDVNVNAVSPHTNIYELQKYNSRFQLCANCWQSFISFEEAEQDGCAK